MAYAEKGIWNLGSYLNRIRRKHFVLNTTAKAKRYVKKTVNSIESLIESAKTLDQIIYKQIKEGLDYGYDPKYYIKSGSLYNPSIENEYITYHKEEASYRTYEKIFDALANTLIPNYFSKYSDIKVIIGEDEEGKFFEVKLI